MKSELNSSSFSRLGLARRLPFFYGWIIVAGGFLGTFIGGGLQSFTFSIFLEPMSSDLGWSRTALTGALTLQLIVASALAPLFGRMIDKSGPRLIMLVLSFVGGAVAVTLSHVKEIWQFYLVFALAGMSGGAGLGSVVTGAAVSKWFVRLRGRALAFTTMGSAAPGAILAPIVTVIVFTYGWRLGWVTMGMLFWFVLLPFSLLMARQPEDLGLLPDNAKNDEEVRNAYTMRGGLASSTSWTLSEAIRTKSMWLLVLALVMGGVSTSSVVLHEFSFVRNLGYSPTIAAAVLSTHASTALIIRPLWGVLLEYVPVRFCMAGVYIGSFLAILILLNAQSVQMVFAFALVYGMSIAGHAVSHAVVFANYFGRDHVGAIRGFVTPITAVASGLGPLIVSLGFDHLNGYYLPFAGLAALLFLGAPVFLLAKPPESNNVRPNG